jgi:DNA-binding PadR family transcriptional regulator
VRKLVEEENKWIDTEEDIISVDLKGNEINLKNVPAQINKKTKIVKVFIDDVIKAEQKYVATENSLDDPRQIQILLLLYAEPKYITRGYVKQTFRFNKMLFDLWQRMKKNDFGDSYIHDEFVSGRAGPIPKNLKPLMNKLAERDLVKVSWSKRPGISSEFVLTDEGTKIAKSVWENIPDEIKLMILKTKEEWFLVDATQMKHIFHKKYPEYKKTYVEIDKED